MKYKLGIVLILFSIILLFFHFFYKKNLEQKNVSDVSNYINNTSVTKVNVEPVKLPEEKKKQEYSINYTAILEIPSINLKRGVIDSTNNFKSITYSISVDKTSIYPNEKGNFILYAHSGNSSIAYFKNLNNVKVNDDIYVYYNGVKYHYIVCDKYDVEKAGKVKLKYFGKENYIDLITCNQSRKGYQIIVVGVLQDTINY